MADDFERMVRRALAGDKDRGRRRKSAAPPSRPPMTAHPCVDWDDEHVHRHLEACRTGRDEHGEWVPRTTAESWAYLWETMPSHEKWPVREVEVP